MNDDHNERRPPPPIDEKLLDNQWRDGKTRQETTPRPPLRALKTKGDQLRNAVRHGNQLDWSDITSCFADLWQEARLCLWRAKHSKPGIKVTDPKTGKQVLTFGADEKVVLEAINTVRGILDSMIRLRREVGNDSTGIPHWAVVKIEKALRNHPEALADLLKALAAEDEFLH
jgi:hypothetical protein